MTRFLYDVLFFFFALLYLPLFFLKGKHARGFSERFGVVPQVLREELKGKTVVWVHAVSLGETLQAVRAVDAFRPRMPGARFVFTTTTATGHQAAERLKREEDRLLYFPVDFSFAVKSFVNGVSPSAVVLFETEIWPNLIAELYARGIPVFILNARISDKAMRRYRYAGFLMKPTLKRVTAIAAQDELSGERFRRLGADAGRLSVTGNMKFDWQPPAPDPALAQIETILREGKPLLCVAGSTHDGEEGPLFDAYKNIKARYPAFRLVVAPRHLERIGAIEALAAKKNLPLVRISAILNGSKNGYDSGVFLLDRIGVLASVYGLADVVFVGGSLVPVGGHNLAEPAYFARPILFGPFMSNFKEMAEEFKRSGSAVQVTAAGLESELVSLIEDAPRRRSLGSAAKQVLERHAGATRKNLELFLKAMGENKAQAGRAK